MNEYLILIFYTIVLLLGWLWVKKERKHLNEKQKNNELNNELKRKIVKKNVLIMAMFKQLTPEQKNNVKCCCEECNGTGKIENHDCRICNGTGVPVEIFNDVLEVTTNDF